MLVIGFLMTKCEYYYTRTYIRTIVVPAVDYLLIIPHYINCPIVRHFCACRRNNIL